MTPLQRFLRIERSRAEVPEERLDPDGVTAERIEGLEEPGKAPSPPTASGADLERFAPPPPPSIELLATDGDERPFTRCMRCGMDHGVFATECTGCGASLDTAEQREFNEELWRKRQEERAVEARMSAEREELMRRSQAEAAASTRAMGEALAREVGASERRRLEGQGILGGLRVSEPFASLIRWVQRRIS